MAAGAAQVSAGSGPEEAPRELYESARALADGGRYGKAARLYDRFAESSPGSPLAPEAKFRQAECLELMKDGYMAFKVYQELLEQYPTFPNTAEVLHRQLGIGIALMERKGLIGRNLSRARDVFRKVVHNAPFGESAPRAQFNLAMTFEMRKEYSEAVMEFGKVISNYPGSDVVDDADYHIALCHYRKARMAPHDQSVAAVALSALTGFLKRYPADPKAADAQVKKEEIAGRKAKSLFEIAEYYEKTGSPKSAIYYYQEIIDEYPGLELGRRAELKIKRDFELAGVDKRIEALTEEYDAIREEEAYARNQIRRLRRPETGWHVWKYLKQPAGAKGERLAQERERLRTLGKEAAEKKREIRKVAVERRSAQRITGAQLKVDRARWRKQAAQMELATAGDDRPAPPEEGVEDAAAMKAYERELSRKRAGVERGSRAVERAEKRLDLVRASNEGAKGRKDARASRTARVRKKALRENEFREKISELASDLAAERRNERVLAGEERKQERLLKRAGGEPSEAAASLSLISSRRLESGERVSELERDIGRRKRIHELELRYEVAMSDERGAEAKLLQVEATAHEGRKGILPFKKGDPLTAAVERLDRCRSERRLLENELSDLTSGKEYVGEKEKRRAERERSARERAAAKESAVQQKAEARRSRAADREEKRREQKSAREKRDLERIEEAARARQQKEEARSARAAGRDEKSARETRAMERAEESARARHTKEMARETAARARRERLQGRLSAALRMEEEEAARLDELRASGESHSRRVLFFFPSDPVRSGEVRLERLRRRREDLEREMDAAGAEEAPAPAP